MFLLWKFLITTFASSRNHKSWRRLLGDNAFRFLAGAWNIEQFQFFFGTTFHVYRGWAKRQGLPIIVDDVGTRGAQLLWIGPRNTTRVVLYFHGGGYVVPLQDFGAAFWNYVRVELKREVIEAGFAILSYSILPTNIFPTQLIQAVQALQHVIDSGCNPREIHIVGDSAGGNLALAVISHMLHPVEGVPSVSLTSRLRGIFLMSPWVSLTGDTGSHGTNDPLDVVGAETLRNCGHKVLEGIPESLHVYLEASKAPEGWFKGVDTLVDRILVTAGGDECLRDDIVKVAERLAEHHNDVSLIIQENGIHNDPFFDFFAREPTLGDLTPRILRWMRQGMIKSKSMVIY